jgi:hypothetical protein
MSGLVFSAAKARDRQSESAALPRFAKDFLASCPRTGSGVHNWLFRAARKLHPYYSDKEALEELLETAAYGCGREIPRREIRDAIANSEHCAYQTTNAHQARLTSQREWPDVDERRLKEIINKGTGQADLRKASPIRIAAPIPPCELVADLFPKDCLLCCGAAVNQMFTKPADEWGSALNGCQFIVPSPMSAPIGTTKDGRPSQRCLDNTGPRRFLVTEFDHGSFDEQAAIILHLAAKMPLTMALHSGGKSLHAWFYCAGLPEERLRAYMRWAVTLGADPATWNRCQAVRMPEAVRDNGKQQKVLFLNSGTIK